MSSVLDNVAYTSTSIVPRIPSSGVSVWPPIVLPSIKFYGNLFKNIFFYKNMVDSVIFRLLNFSRRLKMELFPERYRAKHTR